MAQSNMVEEGYNITMPPKLTNFDFSQWKARMRIFIMAQDVELWEMVLDGLEVMDEESLQMNARAMNLIYNALDSDQFKLISKCSTAKETWERLEDLYGESRKVKEIEGLCESQTSNQEELCIMALEELEVISSQTQSSEYCFDDFQYSFDKLQYSFDDLENEFAKMNERLEQMISKLIVQNEFLIRTKVDFEKQNEKFEINFKVFQKKNDCFEKENLDLKMKFEKVLNEKQNFLNDSLNTEMTQFNYVHSYGHFSYTCHNRKHAHHRIRQVWIVKGTRDLCTNSHGPKVIWVPKVK